MEGRSAYAFLRERKIDEGAAEKYAGRQKLGAVLIACACICDQACIQRGQIPRLAMNNSTVVNQPVCNPFTRTAQGKGGEERGGCPSFELTPGCKWMFFLPFMGSSTCVCVRKKEREVFMSRCKILGRLR